MHSVAEQVEDAEMAAMLHDMGVDYLQGYHIHRPEALPHWQPIASAQAAAPVLTMSASHLTLVK
jgi:EAL domain-containing protein (putative c-di-GMP-specific phosphodiesterase class I)